MEEIATNIESGVEQTIGGLVSQISNQHLSLVILLFASKYALRSRVFDLIFGNFFGSILMTWLTAFFVFRNVRVAGYWTIILIVSNFVLEKFFGVEGFDTENRNIHPSCMNKTMQQILENFKGDKDKLQTAMLNAVNTNHTSDALTATQLASYGYDMGDCGIFPEDATNEI